MVWSNEHHSQTRVHTHLNYKPDEAGTRPGTTHVHTRARIVNSFEHNCALPPNEPMLSKRGRKSNTALPCENKTHAPTQPHTHKYTRTCPHAHARTRMCASNTHWISKRPHALKRTQTRTDAHTNAHAHVHAHARHPTPTCRERNTHWISPQSLHARVRCRTNIRAQPLSNDTSNGANPFGISIQNPHG